MVSKKVSANKTVGGVIGVLLIIFGVIGSLSIVQIREYFFLVITAISVIAGVILVAWSFTD